MWLAELSRRSGLSTATVKFYLREGLLHAGVATGATRSRYDESHVRRLRLIRALTEIAGLKLDAVRQVLDDLGTADSWHTAIGSAHTQLSRSDAAPAGAAAMERVSSLLERQRWELALDSPHRHQLARALEALAELDHPVSDDLLDAYAAALRPVAEREVRSVRSPDREASAEAAVIGTLLQEPVLLLVRRIAQENASRELDA